MILVLKVIFDWTFIAWQLCSLLRSLGLRTGPLNSIRAELHPFRWFLCVAAYVLYPIAYAGSAPWWTHGIFLVQMLNCWTARHDNDDDDRWKRRRKALADRVSEIGGRLVVVPNTG